MCFKSNAVKYQKLVKCSLMLVKIKKNNLCSMPTSTNSLRLKFTLWNETAWII